MVIDSITNIANSVFVIILIIGALSAFAGFKFFRLYTAFCGAILVGLLSILVVGLNSMDIGVGIFLIIVGALLGAIIGYIMPLIGAAITSGIMGFLLGVILASSVEAGIFAGILFAIIGVFIGKEIIIISSSIIGALLVGVSSYVLADMPGAAVLHTTIAFTAILGIVIQGATNRSIITRLFNNIAGRGYDRNNKINDKYVNSTEEYENKQKEKRRDLINTEVKRALTAMEKYKGGLLLTYSERLQVERELLRSKESEYKIEILRVLYNNKLTAFITVMSEYLLIIFTVGFVINSLKYYSSEGLLLIVFLGMISLLRGKNIATIVCSIVIVIAQFITVLNTYNIWYSIKWLGVIEMLGVVVAVMAIIKETLKEGEEVSGALTGGLWNTDESNHDTAMDSGNNTEDITEESNADYRSKDKDCVVTNINN